MRSSRPTWPTSAPDGSNASGGSFVRLHATGLTVACFLVAALVLGVSPLPDAWRPVHLGSGDEVEAVVARVFRKPRMTLASLESLPEADPALSAALAPSNADPATAAGPGPSASSALSPGVPGRPPTGPGDPSAGDAKRGGAKRGGAHLASMGPVGAGALLGTGESAGTGERLGAEAPAGAAAGGRQARDRQPRAPDPQTLAHRRLAGLLDAPGAAIENPCIDFDEHGCARTALDPFFASLDAVDRGEVGSHATVVTLGNSLIASDHVTDIVRERLVARFGSAGRGFLLPDRLSKVAGRRVRTGRGTAGWDIHTFAQKAPGIDRFGFSGSAHESTGAGERIRWSTGGATRARLFYLERPQAAGFTLDVDGEPIARIEPAAQDEPRDRIFEFELPVGSERVQLTTLGKGVVLYGIAFASDAPGAVFDTIGVPASDATLYLKSDEGIFSRQLEAREPSLVVLMIGGNEIRSLAYGWTDLDAVAADYGALIDRVRRAVPDAACLAVAPIDAAKATAAGAELTTRKETLDVVDMERKVAAQKGCAFFNLFAAMGGEGSLHRFHQRGMVHDDLVHPKGKGGDVLGQLFADALLESYRETPAPRVQVQAKKRLVRPDLYGLVFPKAKREVLRGQDEPPARPLGRLFDQLRALEQGASLRLAIGHFGDTHVHRQSWSDRLRERLGERFGTGGRGYVAVGHRDGALLPGRVVRSLSGPVDLTDGRDITVGGAVAMNGTKARLRPRARFDISFCDGCREGRFRPRGFLELSWLYTPDMGVADVFVNDVQVGVISPLRRRTESDVQFLRIPVRGEAHTLSVVVREGPDDTSGRRRRRFEGEDDQLPAGPVNLFGVTGEVNRAGVVVDALGLSGATGMTMQRWRQDLVREQVAARHYDLILAAWGTEETAFAKLDLERYRDAYDRSIATLLEASPDADCVLLGPTDRLVRQGGEWQPAPLQEAVAEVQRQVAAARGCAYFETRRAMGETGGMAAWTQEGLAEPNHTILTAKGYAQLTDLFLHDLLALYAYDEAREAERLARANPAGTPGRGPTGPGAIAPPDVGGRLARPPASGAGGAGAR